MLKTMNALFKLSVMILVIQLFAGCRGDQKTEIAQPNIKKQEAPVVADKKEIVVTDKKVVGEIDTQRRVDFSVSEEFLNQIDDNGENYLQQLPSQLGKDKAEKRKVKISGGVLLDADKEVMIDRSMEEESIFLSH